MSRKCLFCGATPVSEEHLWSDWISAGLKSRLGQDTVVDFSTADRMWASDSVDMTFRGFCAECNNGWMAEVDGRVRAIGSKLMLADPPFITIKVKQQKTLALWAYMKALVMDPVLRGRAAPPIPGEAYRKLFTARAVPADGSVAVWMAAYNGNPSGFARRATITVTISEKEPVYRVGLNFYLITIGFGHLVLQVAGPTRANGLARLAIRRWDPLGYAGCIWPPRDRLDWPPGRLLTVDSIDPFSKRGLFVRVSRQ